MPLVNPAIAMGIRPIEIQQRDPLQDYAQIAAIQNAQLQNQLARQQMEQEQGVLNYLREPGKLATPEGRAGLRQFGKTGLAYEKLISEQETNALKRQELEGKLRDQRMTALGTGLTSVLADPSDANLAAAFDRLDATGVDTKPFRQQFAGMPDLAARKAAITQYVTSNPEGRQALAFVQPKPEKFDLNGKIVIVDMNPNSPTYQQQVKEYSKGMSPDASARLAFDKKKFEWEQANPGFELQQDTEGNFFGVNKRTLQAVPVMVGGAAPAAAPAAPGAGMPGPRVPAPAAPAAQVIPGMRSMLDQPAPAPAAAPGSPLKGAPKSKDTSVSEQQASYNIARVLNAAKEINDITKKDPTALAPGGLEATLKSTGLEGAANLARSANRQIVNGAQRDALDALLYLATGAAYNKEQLQGAYEAYIPSYTDDPVNREAKQARMANLIQDAKIRAGKAWTPKMDAAMQSLTGEAPAKFTAPVKITGDADYEKLPSGALFIGPDGQQRRKP